MTHLVQNHVADVVLLAHLLDPAPVRTARLLASVLVPGVPSKTSLNDHEFRGNLTVGREPTMPAVGDTS